MKKYSLKKYSHAYDFAFEVESYTEDASDVTPVMIRTALVARALRLSDTEIPEACGVYDTGEILPPAHELPPSHVDSPLYDKWLAIVTQMEAEGCDRSDAQSIADIEVAN